MRLNEKGGGRGHTKSARYVSIFEDWIEFLLLKLKSCAFLHQTPGCVSVKSTAMTFHCAGAICSIVLNRRCTAKRRRD